MLKGQLGCEYPQEYEFINNGIAGNRIVDVYARINTDIINPKPDSLLRINMHIKKVDKEVEIKEQTLQQKGIEWGDNLIDVTNEYQDSFG